MENKCYLTIENKQSVEFYDGKYKNIMLGDKRCNSINGVLDGK
jgi:hypothetical protein